MRQNFHIPMLLITGMLFLISGCSVNKAKVDDSLKQHFDNAQVDGCFTMIDNASGEITVYNMKLDTARKLPGSTFHILGSLMALETGVLPDEKTEISIDSLKYSGWKGKNPISLTDAFQQDADPFFATVMEKMGSDTIKGWIDSIGYGNKNFGAKGELFWMNNQLKISPDEQLGFMKKLYFDQLPFRKSVMESLRGMMMREDNSAYRLSYQSAEGLDEKKQKIAWTCGWIEENRHVYLFVTMIDAGKQEGDAKKKCSDLTKNILKGYGFFLGKK